MTIDILFYVLLPIIAFLYASVGHGGASGYLALMSLFGFLPDTMRSTALLLNILVAGIAFYQYKKTVVMPWRICLWLLIASVPAAFTGGIIELDATFYKKILGALLLVPAIKLSGFFKIKLAVKNSPNIIGLLLIGASIGLLSGMIGIGGGIILSPILLLLAWTNFKETAAISSIFIFLNSIAGFAGMAQTGITINNYIYAMIVLAAAGGLAGAYFGANKFSSRILKLLLSFVLLLASLKLIFVS